LFKTKFRKKKRTPKIVFTRNLHYRLDEYCFIAILLLNSTLKRKSELNKFCIRKIKLINGILYSKVNKIISNRIKIKKKTRLSKI